MSYFFSFWRSLIYLSDLTRYLFVSAVLCEGCKMINGAGFNSHPNECDLFVHCYFGELGLRAIIRKCPFGQFWNQTILSCEYSERAYCPMGKYNLHLLKLCGNKRLEFIFWILWFCFFIDRCAYIKDRDYEASENCRAYWECSNGHSRGKCCRYGYRYVRGEGCVLDSDNICKESCPMEMPTDLHSYNNGKCLELNDHVSNKSILIQNIRKIINIC